MHNEYNRAMTRLGIGLLSATVFRANRSSSKIARRARTQPQINITWCAAKRKKLFQHFKNLSIKKNNKRSARVVEK